MTSFSKIPSRLSIRNFQLKSLYCNTECFIEDEAIPCLLNERTADREQTFANLEPLKRLLAFSDVCSVVLMVYKRCSPSFFNSFRSNETF